MYIAILGRQPALGIAELERVFGDVSWFSDQSAVIKTTSFDIERLGGTQKAGRVVAELPRGDWRRASMQLVKAYTAAWSEYDGKITLGISAYGFDVSPRDVQKTGIILKGKLKNSGVSLRLVPNQEPALNTATAHHNKLGLADNKVELLVVRARNGRVIIAESTGAQNITALARRDQERPKRDAFVGMLPPKLAQIMINLASATPAFSNKLVTKQVSARRDDSAAASLYPAELPYGQTSSNSQETSAESSGSIDNVSWSSPLEKAAHATPDMAHDSTSTPARVADRPAGPASSDLRETASGSFDDGSGVDGRRGEQNDRSGASKRRPRLLDPFCGTGVLLQEALLLDYDVYGTDLSDKMIDFSEANLKWIKELAKIPGNYEVHQGDAMNTVWHQPIDIVACESYLGQPFSAPPSSSKLTEVRGNCDHIISTFLKNIHTQLTSGTPLCVAVPAWRAADGNITHLPLVNKLSQLGYNQAQFKNIRPDDLLYYREDQVVARELLVLTKK